MAIFVTDGVEEGNLGMVTTLCCQDQARWMPPKCALLYINVTYQSQVWWW